MLWREYIKLWTNTNISDYDSTSSVLHLGSFIYQEREKALTWYLSLLGENWHQAHWESRNIRTTCSSCETHLQSESKSNLWSLIDFTLLNTPDSQAETWIMRTGEQIIVSHDVTGGPNDVNIVDLQLHLHVFCNKSPLSVSLSPPLLYTFGKMGAATTCKSQQRLMLITAFKIMEQTAFFPIAADANWSQAITGNPTCLTSLFKFLFSCLSVFF